MARTPLFFWAGEWNTWPVSLSLSDYKKNAILIYSKLSILDLIFPIYEKLEI